jgi:hypothetical protein
MHLKVKRFPSTYHFPACGDMCEEQVTLWTLHPHYSSLEHSVWIMWHARPPLLRPNMMWTIHPSQPTKNPAGRQGFDVYSDE